MIFKTPLRRAILIRRYKRFLADVMLEDGAETTVHVPNPGAMLGLTAPGSPVWLSVSPDPKRKLPLTLELIEADGGLVGVNTMNPNRIAEAGIAAGLVPELAGYAGMRREVRYDLDSRIDLLLTDASRPPAHVEIKNVHFLRRPGLIEFPDCRTTRGVKHLKALERVVAAGGRAVMLFVVQRMDGEVFTTADDLDPAYGPALRAAAEAGVEVLCYACHVSPEQIRLDRRLPWSPHAPESL
ncbi:DNA/RNA nuclease SfsA [Brevundimonas balnearis]|uniref:Sugar fermentation stimulation protein homolog n=1 Tax=Brevundimonas balnearis TaxID=1572858 RepID=A0ABV6R3S2_9CAUL